MERKSAQPSPRDLLYEPAIEVRKNRPGLLGYVAAKALLVSPKAGSRRLAFLAYWKVAPMAKGLFFLFTASFFQPSRPHCTRGAGQSLDTMATYVGVLRRSERKQERAASTGIP
jgi:hypothetical protein